jgi:hypothetical protein
VTRLRGGLRDTRKLATNHADHGGRALLRRQADSDEQPDADPVAQMTGKSHPTTQSDKRPKIVLTPANLNALLHGYPVVTSEAIIVLDKPVRRG